ncbi:RNA polymerase I-specific transcription initiation factor RRN3 [Hemicordylus capensis]|uniref:RNA polymerase I-specific transcription initiation factor RRN3 n=1 Tax=Hemicordylus capensis TaxID=884348 RepID=UPI002304B59F|nr:RNA polymerase I-specific transcription initiation factor RRN3 [Hemicordylus capensis]
MLAADEFLSSPPRKTVRFGGTLTEILLKYQKGETTDFDLLKHQLLDPDIKDGQLINWLHEFRSSVTYLTKEFEQLVNVLLKVPWVGRSPLVVEEYLALLSNLVSAQTIYLRPCLAMIVSHFVPPRITIRENDMDVSDTDDDDENVSGGFNTCHRALQTIAKYVPLTPQFLMPVLVEKFPFANKSERTLQCYVHNVLRISGYIPTLRHDILELVIEKLLKIDVSAPRKDIEAAEEAEREDTAEEGLFEMDEDGENPEKDDMMAHPIAERLDILMIVLFSYIKDICHVNGKLDIGNTKDLYRDLVAIFDKLILTTHGSCHVQYVIFYLCSFKLGIAEAFVEHVWKKLQNPNTPAVIRQAAASYIGSFLARAKFVPVVTVKACLDLLVNWLHLYIDNQGTGSKAFCDVALHGPFYAACQAVLYVVVFRHKQILDENLKKGLAFLQKLNFERIVMCQLNPLMVCLPSIVNFFAAITRKYQVAFCDTIIERNRRQVLPVVRSSGGGDSVEMCTNPLDSFFPFDPCILKRSKNIINPLYQFWEEQDAENLREDTGVVNECKGEEEDDFLKGEPPQNDGFIDMTSGSFDSTLQSPKSCIGSPPVPSL